MKAINIGTRYEIYDDALKTYDTLPAQTYTVCFSKMSGFYLEHRADMTVQERIYGVHQAKVEKVIGSFRKFERNLGVILSGAKGIGKSVFAKMLSERAIAEGIPVLVVPEFIPGIASYIESITQEIMVLFDEFDKTVCGISPSDGDVSPQDTLLGLFDGTTSGKKLFVITCNSIEAVSSYLVNRPGRFHYHFRFKHPDADEIRVYLYDVVDKEFQAQIEEVVNFAKLVPLNYDCLRSIAFELNSCSIFAEAIEDLNIVNMGGTKYSAELKYADGRRMNTRAYGTTVDWFDHDEEVDIGWLEDLNGTLLCRVVFSRKDIIQSDTAASAIIVPGNKLGVTYDTDYDESKAYIGAEILSLTLRPMKSSVGEHYKLA